MKKQTETTKLYIFNVQDLYTEDFQTPPIVFNEEDVEKVQSLLEHLTGCTIGDVVAQEVSL